MLNAWNQSGIIHTRGGSQQNEHKINNRPYVILLINSIIHNHLWLIRWAVYREFYFEWLLFKLAFAIVNFERNPLRFHARICPAHIRSPFNSVNLSHAAFGFVQCNDVYNMDIEYRVAYATVATQKVVHTLYMCAWCAPINVYDCWWNWRQSAISFFFNRFFIISFYFFALFLGARHRYKFVWKRIKRVFCP